MLRSAGSTLLTASDLVGHLNCRHLTRLDLAVAEGALVKPVRRDPLLELLAERGFRHEQGFVDHLKAAGYETALIDGVGVDPASMKHTLDVMKAGVQIIVQGALRAGHWSGRADVLKRVETPSQLGAWSYEVIDTKLARETKGGTVLQLCLYSDLLDTTQRHVPEFAHVVVPGSKYEPEQYRVADFAAYYRLVRASLERAVASAEEETYPDPKEHCEICRWQTYCDAKRRKDNHLSLVAGISKSQIGELQRRNVATTADLALMPLPVQWKPDRGSTQSYEKVREQARVQMRGRAEGKVVYEALGVDPGFGLTRLPVPSTGDIFFDLEADPFVGDGGLEFLFGYAVKDKGDELTYVADWATSRVEEKQAFERFVDFVIARLKTYPDLHIYHYASYEPSALKRLMGRYVTRENELDRMLRSELFVDLYAVARHGIRASVESYSIKKLEPLYAFERTVLLPNANIALAKVQACLELDDLTSINEKDRATVQGYNRDDCFSTWRLREWLETLRATLIAGGTTIARPVPKPGDSGEDLSAWQQKIEALVNRLTHDVPVDPTQRTAGQHASWVLAYILDWHRREQKAVWWEHFRLRNLSAEDLLEERAGLSGLAFSASVGGTAKAPIHRYSFQVQETDLRGGEDLRQTGGEKFGKVEEISFDDRTIDIKKRQDTAGVHPVAVYAHKVVDLKVLAEALVRIGEYVADNGIEGRGSFQAARDLLMLVAPRLGGRELREPDEPGLAAAIRIAPHLDSTVLPIQGPPGAGKTHTGARMICALAKSGKKIGITANSHKVIRNVLDEVLEAARDAGITVRCMQKVTEKEANIPGLQFTTDNAALLGGIGSSYQVAAGTAWLWARPDAFESLIC